MPVSFPLSVGRSSLPPVLLFSIHLILSLFLLSHFWIKQNWCLWKVDVMNTLQIWWGWGWVRHESCPRKRGRWEEVGVYYDKYWEVEWAIVLPQCGSTHFLPLQWNVALWLGGAQSCYSGSYIWGHCFEATCIPDTHTADKLRSRMQIFSVFTALPDLGDTIIEREHADKANGLPPTLHFCPWGSCQPSQAHTSFTKYSSVSTDPLTHTTEAGRIKMSAFLWQK